MVPFIFFIFFCHTKCTKKERKNTLQNKSDEEALNRNHGATNIVIGGQVHVNFYDNGTIQIF